MAATPTPNKDGPLPDEERLRLVAYLDGELAAADRQAVEAQLGKSDSLRVEMQQLERVWNALDELPQATVNDNFTRSTVEIVTADAQREVEQLTVALPAQRRRMSYGSALACVAALLIGAVAARTLATRHDRQVIALLPVLYQVDVLGQFRDPAFLRQLQQRVPELIANYQQSELQDKTVLQRANDWREIVDGSHADRLRWVARQSDAEKSRLQRSMKRLADSSTASRDQATAALDALSSQTDATELYTVAVAYQAWLTTQSPAARAQLRQIDNVTERIAAVRKLFRDSRNQAQRTLTDDEAEAIRDAILSLVDDPGIDRVRQQVIGELRRMHKKRPNLRMHLPPDLRAFETRFSKFPAGAILVVADLAGAQNDRSSNFLRQRTREQFRKLVEESQAAWPAIEEQLVSRLSESKQRLIEKLPAAQRLQRLRGWVREAAIGAFQPNDAAIETFFAEEALTDEQRLELLALPVEEMRQRLRQLYIEHNVGVAMPITTQTSGWQESRGAKRRQPGPGREPTPRRRGPRGGGP